MKHKTAFAVVFAASLPAALWLWSHADGRAPLRPQAAPVGAGEQPSSAPRGAAEGRLRALETQVRRLTDAAQAHAAQAAVPPDYTDPTDGSLGTADTRHAEPVPPEVAVANRLERFSRLTQEQTADPAGAELVRKEVTAKLTALGLERVNLTGVDCYQTLCRLDLGFSDLGRRDDDLSQALDQLHSDFYAYVADGKAAAAEVYLARPGHGLFSKPNDEEL